MDFKSNVLQKLVSQLQSLPEVLAIWEGGSAANATSDAYSDIDLNILTSDSGESTFEKVAETLSSISEITHLWNEPKSIWPELTQKIYFLKDSPKHFFIDVAVFPKASTEILKEFMQVERHGQPVIHFDRSGLIVPIPVDLVALSLRQKKRLEEMVAAFPIYRTEVFKELDRGHKADAFAFFQGAMLKPLVEVLGMLHRPSQFDFGFRYLKRTFPPDIFGFIEKCLFVSDADQLRKNALEVDRLFYESVNQVRNQSPLHK